MDLLFLTYNSSEACSFYRCSGIAHHLRKITGYNISVAQWKDLGELTWGIISQYDIIFMQRPFGKEAAVICNYIKDCGKKLWVDYDDNLLALNPENQNYELYNKKEVKLSIVGIINQADAVSVTNEYMRQCFAEFNNNIWVIPNAHNDFLLKREDLPERKKMVFWRGSQSHIYDLMSHKDIINKCSDEYKDWRFNYMGFYPWFLKKAENNGFIKGMDIILYFKTLFSLAPSLVQVPLSDDVFNHSKSNISFLEASYAGAASLVPAYWNLPNTLLYSNDQEYLDYLYFALKGEFDLKKMAEDSWEFVQEYFLLSKINYKRKQLIESL